MRAPRACQLYMYQSPRKAKRLYFDVIPRAVDEYVGHLAAYPKEEQAAKLMNPVWHIHQGEPPKAELPISFALLLNLASARTPRTRRCCGASSAAMRPTPRRKQHPLLDQLVGYAIRYFHDFVKPAKSYRAPRQARAGGAARSRCAARPTADRRACRGDPGRGLCRRQGARLRAAARLVLGALRGAARPDARAALRLLRRALRHPRNQGADSERAGGLSGPALLRIRLAVRPPSPRAVRLVRIGPARKLSGSRWRFDRRANADRCTARGR